MALIKYKPRTPGTRAVVKVDRSHLHKGGPRTALTAHQYKTGGRNHFGRITTRHKGGGHKQHYRIVDFRRTKDGIPAKVERLEYDPNRTANIALLLYADGIYAKVKSGLGAPGAGGASDIGEGVIEQSCVVRRWGDGTGGSADGQVFPAPDTW